MTEQELNQKRADIAARCRARREELGLTQVDVANQTGLSEMTIKRVESGRFWLGLKQFVILCDVLKMDVATNS